MPATPPKSSVQVHRITNTASPTNTAAVTCYEQAHAAVAPRKLIPESCTTLVPESIMHQYHTDLVGPNQCSSAVLQHIAAPVATVWSVVRRFDQPHVYKHFLKSCQVITGNGDVGTLREVTVVSGLPAVSSREQLEILDDEQHVMSFRVVGGDHRLANYRSVTTLHSAEAGRETVVIESYLVDVPPGNSCEETRMFVDTIVRCNLKSLARIAEATGST